MSEEGFWFEEVPEEERYWFLAPSSMTLSREYEREAEQEKSGLSSQHLDDLRDIEHDVRSVFGGTEKVREDRKKNREMHERMDEVRYGVQALEGDWWLSVLMWEHHQEPVEYLKAPMLYTRREQAEEEAWSVEAHVPDAYQELIEERGQADADDLFDSSLPYTAQWVDRNTLLNKLEDASFLCVMVDGGMKLRRDLIEKLRADEEERG